MRAVTPHPLERPWARLRVDLSLSYAQTKSRPGALQPGSGEMNFTRAQRQHVPADADAFVGGQ